MDVKPKTYLAIAAIVIASFVIATISAERGIEAAEITPTPTGPPKVEILTEWSNEEHLSARYVTIGGHLAIQWRDRTFEGKRGRYHSDYSGIFLVPPTQ